MHYGIHDSLLFSDFHTEDDCFPLDMLNEFQYGFSDLYICSITYDFCIVPALIEHVYDADVKSCYTIYAKSIDNKVGFETRMSIDSHLMGIGLDPIPLSELKLGSKILLSGDCNIISIGVITKIEWYEYEFTYGINMQVPRTLIIKDGFIIPTT